MRTLIVHDTRHFSKPIPFSAGRHVGLAEAELLSDGRIDEVLAVNAALDDLATQDPQAAKLVKLRLFVGMTNEEAATALGVSSRSIRRLWVYAKAWLRETLGN